MIIDPNEIDIRIPYTDAELISDILAPPDEVVKIPNGKDGKSTSRSASGVAGADSKKVL